MVSGLKTYELFSFLVIFGVQTFKKGLQRVKLSETSPFTPFSAKISKIICIFYSKFILECF